jgi:hypothetical protein
MYHYRVVASNDGGTTQGADRTFPTRAHSPVLPIAITNPAGPVEIQRRKTQLSGVVNPNGLDTNVVFQLGTSPNLGNATAAQLIGGGNEHIKVTAELNGLADRTTYYFRVVATNAAGTVYSETGKLCMPYAVRLVAIVALPFTCQTLICNCGVQDKPPLTIRSEDASQLLPAMQNRE